ncbi:gamma-glutamyl-gamma-aminobutyrate hydrolase family protein [Shimia ponticola]|uniref:gamma-glutamyl-gamma-aminobutyrate hydrolase family protein n=1 Tax=Shimia ponticola TaxID=2582893 RepID=UPI0011BFD1E5|nr:type 1 glutamine amidotransferase [Shimia ponticola]
MTRSTDRPIIGVTVSRRSGWRIFPLIRFNLWWAGARAVKWQRQTDVNVDAVDGVIVGGGDDISPTLYGAELAMEARLDPGRDAIERDIVCRAWEDNIPMLGICRGAQMINVALGGTLDQDAYASFGAVNYKTILPRKTVHVNGASRLAAITGTDDLKVNALHTQAVDELASGIRVAASDESGMVQAIERIKDPFLLGVQWHPEHLIYAHRQRAIFKALVEAARAYQEGRKQVRAVDKAFA